MRLGIVMNLKRQKWNDPYIQRYTTISNWFKQKQIRMRTLVLFYRYTPLLVVVSYFYLLIECLITKGSAGLIRVILVPFFAFVLVTLMRKLFNQPRPYAKYEVEPLIYRKKSGESFPSRHTLSVSIIAMAWLWVNPVIGIILWLLAFIIAATRVLSGVHFLKDVVAAICISAFIGWIGFFC